MNANQDGSWRHSLPANLAVPFLHPTPGTQKRSPDCKWMLVQTPTENSPSIRRRMRMCRCASRLGRLESPVWRPRFFESSPTSLRVPMRRVVSVFLGGVFAVDEELCRNTAMAVLAGVLIAPSSPFSCLSPSLMPNWHHTLVLANREVTRANRHVVRRFKKMLDVNLRRKSRNAEDDRIPAPP